MIWLMANQKIYQKELNKSKIWEIKKTDYDTKLTEIKNTINDHNHHNHDITTLELNTSAADVFNAKTGQNNVTTKIELSSLN